MKELIEFDFIFRCVLGGIAFIGTVIYIIIKKIKDYYDNKLKNKPPLPLTKEQQEYNEHVARSKERNEFDDKLERLIEKQSKHN